MNPSSSTNGNRYGSTTSDTTSLIGISSWVSNTKTGNVWWATLDGEHLANNRANDFKQTKVWLDEEHGIHIDHLTPRVPITEEQMRSRIHEVLEEHGIFQIN